MAVGVLSAAIGYRDSSGVQSPVHRARRTHRPHPPPNGRRARNRRQPVHVSPARSKTPSRAMRAWRYNAPASPAHRRITGGCSPEVIAPRLRFTIRVIRRLARPRRTGLNEVVGIDIVGPPFEGGELARSALVAHAVPKRSSNTSTGSMAVAWANRLMVTVKRSRNPTLPRMQG